MLKQYLNKGISTPIAIGIILILVIIVGGFTWWQYGEIRKEESNVPEVQIPEKKEVQNETSDHKEKYGYEFLYLGDFKKENLSEYLNKCIDMKEKNEQDKCYLILALAIWQDDPTMTIHPLIKSLELCEKISSEESLKLCEKIKSGNCPGEICKLDLAVALNEPEMCLGTGLDIDESKGENCITELAIKNNNIKLCEEKIFMGNRKGICGAKFALHYGNPSLCQDLLNNEAKETCWEIIGSEEGKKGNPELCKEILNQSAREICNFELAKKMENPEFCEEQSVCIMYFVNETKDSELCKKLKDESLRTFCENCFKVDTSNWLTYKNEEFGLNFIYPKDFFWWKDDPKVIISDCNYSGFPESCPDIKNIVNVEGYRPSEKKVKINNRDYCLIIGGEGAAGTSYGYYYYTTIKNKKCVIIYFTTAQGNCGNVGNSEEISYQKCRLYNDVKEPKIIEKIISTFNFID